MYRKVDTSLDFVGREQEIVEFWKQNHIFEKSVEKNEGGEEFSFFDGPPTANGKPHIGHILTRVMKDIIPRYQTMKGKHVLRKAGWDTHGLPVELEVEKSLGLDGKKEIETYGIKPFNEFVSRAFMLRRRGICSAVVQLGLKKMNNGKDDYSVTTFKLLRDFEGEELRQIRDYADQFKEQVKVMLAQRAEQADAASGDVVEVGTTSRRLPDNEDHFAIGGVIDGEREELPA